MPSVNSKWSFVLTDYQGNSNGPVFGATQRTFSHPLNNMRTCGFTIDIENPATEFLFNPPMVSGVASYPLVKVYRNNRVGTRQLLMVGDVASMKIASRSSEGGGQVSVVAADGLWRLAKRLVGMGVDSMGRGQGYVKGGPGSLLYVSQLVDDILADVNSLGVTGILRGAVPLSGAQGAVFPAVYQQVAATLIAQLSALAGAPDYAITPMEPSTSGTYPVAQIGTLNQYTPLGSHKTNVSFEYGAGQRNVDAYDVTWDRTGQITKAWSLPQGFPSATATGDTTVTATDTTVKNAIGLWEDSIPSDVTSIAMRQALCNNYIAVRKYPRQQITFTPARDSNQDYGTDWSVGDVIGALAVDQDTIVYDGTVRVYGANFTVSDEESESVQLTLIPSA